MGARSLAANHGGRRKASSILDDTQMFLFAELFQSELANKDIMGAEIFQVQTDGKEQPMAKDKSTETCASSTDAPKLTLSSSLRDYRRDTWEIMAKKELVAQPDKARAFLLGLALSGEARLINQQEMERHYRAICGGKTSHGTFYAPEIFKLTEEDKEKLFTAAAVSTVNNVSDELLVKLLKFLDVVMASHWEIDAEFLELLTKADMESYVEHIGLKQIMGKKFDKARAGKKDGFIAAIVDSGFSFNGIIPAEMDYHTERSFK